VVIYQGEHSLFQAGRRSRPMTAALDLGLDSIEARRVRSDRVDAGGRRSRAASTT
jgi:hypothetical protein